MPVIAEICFAIWVIALISVTIGAIIVGIVLMTKLIIEAIREEREQ